MTEQTLTDISAEKALLGAVLVQPTIISEIAVVPSDFYNQKHKWIWEAALDLAREDGLPDIVTVMGRLGADKAKQIGGEQYLISLAVDCPNSTNYQQYADRVIEIARRREALHKASQLANQASKDGVPIEQLSDLFSTMAQDFASKINPAKHATTELEKRFEVHTASYALQTRPPIKYIVENIIREKSVSCFFGESGSKKTYSIIDMVVHVASGKTWLGFQTTKTKVLYIDEETNTDEFSNRLGEVIRGEGCDGNTQISFVSLSGLLLDNKVDLVLLELLIEEQGAGLVVLDALTDVMTGDENDKSVVQPIFTALKQIANRTDTAIIIIHHANKMGAYRGSSAIKGAVDLMVKVESEHDKNIVNFKSEKVRYGQSMSWAAAATWMEDSFTLRRIEVENTPHYSRAEKYVLDYLENNGKSSIVDIEGAADSCSNKAARLAVYSLAGKGKIRRTNPDERGRGVNAFYELDKSGFTV